MSFYVQSFIHSKTNILILRCQYSRMERRRHTTEIAKYLTIEKRKKIKSLKSKYKEYKNANKIKYVFKKVDDQIWQI